MVHGEQIHVLQGLSALKLTKQGTHLQTDIWDLFCSLALVLRPRSHRKLPFKTFTDSFLGNEAIKALASLTLHRPLQSRNLQQDATSTVSLELPGGYAKLLMNIFLEACLIKNASTPDQDEKAPFEKGGIYQFSWKGLRILSDFVQDNGIESDADHLVVAFSTLPMPRPRFCRLERRASSDLDDELVITQSVVTNLFCHFAGVEPNYGLESASDGVRMVDFLTRIKLLDGIKAVNDVHGDVPLGQQSTASKSPN